MEANVQSSGLRSASVDDHPGETLDVAALTGAMSKGDEMAYRTFHDAYVDRLLRYLLVVAAGNEEAAREALQLTFVRVVRHIRIFQREDVFWSWLTVLARSAFADEIKKRRRYFSFLEKFTSHSEVDGAVPEDEDDGGADEKLHALLAHELASLPGDERQLIEQKYIARHTVREIAGELQTTEKAVESKLSRVRRKLKDAVLSGLKHEPSR